MDRRESILEATLTLVTERGLYDAPMAEVASTAGVATGTIYHHFKNKDALILELYADTKSRMTSALLAEQKENGSFQEQFARFWKNLFVFFIRNPQKFLFMQQFDHSPFYNNISQEEHQHHLSPLKQFLKKGIDSGTLRNFDADMAVEMFYGAITRIAKAHIHDFMDIDASKLYKAIEISWLGMRSDIKTD